MWKLLFSVMTLGCVFALSLDWPGRHGDIDAGGDDKKQARKEPTETDKLIKQLGSTVSASVTQRRKRF